MKEAANAPLPPLEPISEVRFAKIMRTLRAALPMRGMDEDSGDLWAATYYRMLGHYSEKQIAFMAGKAAATCKWFPSIAECIEIISEWPRDDVFVRLGNAATRTWREHEQTLRAERDLWMDKLRRGEIVDVEAIPPWIVDYARAQGFLLERSIEQVQTIYRNSTLFSALQNMRVEACVRQLGISAQDPQKTVDQGSKGA